MGPTGPPAAALICAGQSTDRDPCLPNGASSTDLHGRSTCPDNQLTGSLPPEWGQLAGMEFLYLDNNQLTGSLPPEWGQLARLWRLELATTN